MFIKNPNNTKKKDIRSLLDNYEQFLCENKIPCIFKHIFSPFKASLDFHKHFKTNLAKLVHPFSSFSETQKSQFNFIYKISQL